MDNKSRPEKARKTATMTLRENVLHTLSKEVHATAKKKGWWNTRVDFLKGLMLVVTELAEAAEKFRQHWDLKKIIIGDNGKPRGVPIEMADVVIRIMDLCEGYGIPLAKAIEMKIEYNKTRPYRHGGKKA